MVKMKLSKKLFEGNDLNSEKNQHWTLFVICLLFIGIGLPIWWKTTEVYRAVLPYDKIAVLSNDETLPIKISIEIENTIAGFDTNPFATLLKSTLQQRTSDFLVHFIYEIEERNTKPNDALSHVPINSIKLIFETMEKENINIYVTDTRIIRCFIPKDGLKDLKQLKKLNERLSSLIQTVVVNEPVVNEALLDRSDAKSRVTRDSLLRKAVKTNPSFDLVFSLLCPEPDKILAKWNIDEAVNLLKPMIEKLKPVFDFDVGSQVLYYVKITYSPTVIKTNGTSLFYVTQDQLSHVINPIEAKLGSQLSSNPTMNFAVYVTEKKRTPLHIRKADKSFSKTNSFLVPRWGALMFYNMEESADSVAAHSVDVNRVVTSFLEHFRTLIGVPTLSTHQVDGDVFLQRPTRDGLADWELDYLMRLRTVENIGSSIHTLSSLSKLLSQISNIVIKDEIANEVYKAVDAVESARRFARDGNLSEALRHSKIAFVAAETAFFDPTLLELLYFPEDQKFAIYVPLFLPVALPIFVSVLKIFKRWKQEKKAKSE